MRRLTLLGLWLSLTLGSAAAHPFHVSLAEAELNPESQRLEVALKVWPEDMEAALAGDGERRPLERIPKLDEALAEVCRKALRLRDAEGEAARMRWVGHELDGPALWLYFELDLPKELEGCSLEWALFFERLPDQANTLNLRRPGQARASLTFTASKARQPWPKPTPPAKDG